VPKLAWNLGVTQTTLARAVEMLHEEGLLEMVTKPDGEAHVVRISDAFLERRAAAERMPISRTQSPDERSRHRRE
jgi:DNA-binding transcriptional MocR family regulator